MKRGQNLDLGVIGNCVIAALVDRAGRLVWLCYPRLDGDPVFCGLLRGEDDGEGVFEIVLEDQVSESQHYLHNTAVLVTELAAAGGARIRITDFMPRFKQYGRIFRPMQLIRRVEPLAGSPRIRVRIRPLFDAGRQRPARTWGSNHLRFVAGASPLRVTTDAPIAYLTEEMPFMLDGPVNFILGPDETLPGSVGAIARDFQEQTEEYWLDWTRFLSVPFEWQDAVIRAAITLKLCSYEETGAIVAALTTSIPEAPDSARNWDYRYCWLRDSYFTVQALNRLGATRTMEDFIRYIGNVVALAPGEQLRPVYGVVPGLPLEERIAEALPGYRGMGPVRLGNQAAEQVQNDSHGHVVLAAAQMFFDQRLPRPGGLDLFHRLEAEGEMAARLALTPDAGIWEYRGRQRVHTHSAVMCWAACDRLAKIARHLGLAERAEHWQGEAERIREAVLARAWSPERESFVESLGGSDIDASLLLLQEVGFVAAGDPRFIKTLQAVEKELRRGHHLFRYHAKDDFGAPETAFSICTFWYIDALAAVGRRQEARELFENLLRCRNHLGLLSEDVDPETGELWGNFPQTYSMVGLVISAMRLSKSWEEAFWRGW
ncbi:MAG: glycoside hydrolase family 15 protein [Alphaproteobacteria bacterium]|nr:glycoside hydrolase family 15 protein [Alphaproteobacteria bacterium]